MHCNISQNTPSLPLNSFKSLFYQFIHAVNGNIEHYAQKKEKLILPKISKSIIIDLCHESESIFRSEPSLIDIKSPCLIIGDLHGHVLDLFRILKYCGIPNDDYLNPKFKDDANFELGENRKLLINNKYVFLGDIIDRGEFSVETITIVLLLKVLFPSNVYLIRGNHEFDFLAKQCGFLEQVYNTFNEYDVPTAREGSGGHGELWSAQNPEPTSGLEVYSAFLSTFSYIPFGIRVDDKMLCVHGGIGPQVFSAKSISQIQRPITEFGVNDVADSLLWSDPSDKPDLGNRPEIIQTKISPQIPPPNSTNPSISFSEPLINPLFSAFIENKPDSNLNNNDTGKLFEPSSRGTGFIFGAPALDEFLHYSNLEVLVRAHECVMAGCEEMFNGRLITVFSASNYCGFVRNYSSVLHVKSEEDYQSKGKGKSTSILQRCDVFRFYPLDYLRKPIPITVNSGRNYESHSGNASARSVDGFGGYKRSYMTKNSPIPQLPKSPINGLRSQYKVSSARSQPEDDTMKLVSHRDIHKMAGIKICQTTSYAKAQSACSNPLPPINMKRKGTHCTELPTLVIPKSNQKSTSVLSSHASPQKSAKSTSGIALMAKMKPRSRSEYK